MEVARIRISCRWSTIRDSYFKEVLRSLQRLKHTRGALPSTSGGYSATSRPSELAHQSIQQPSQVSDAHFSLPDK